MTTGLRYTEVVEESGMRRCQLRSGEITVCELEVWSFRQRFGAVAVAAEGVGGVETHPDFRRRGHAGRLLREALAGMASPDRRPGPCPGRRLGRSHGR